MCIGRFDMRSLPDKIAAPKKLSLKRNINIFNKLLPIKTLTLTIEDSNDGFWS